MCLGSQPDSLVFEVRYSPVNISPPKATPAAQPAPASPPSRPPLLIRSRGDSRWQIQKQPLAASSGWVHPAPASPRLASPSSRRKKIRPRCRILLRAAAFIPRWPRGELCAPRKASSETWSKHATFSRASDAPRGLCLEVG